MQIQQEVYYDEGDESHQLREEEEEERGEIREVDKIELEEEKIYESLKYFKGFWNLQEK